MELREIIIVFGLVAIGVIVWDGMRRMKRPPSKTKSEPYLDPEDVARKAQLARELPNGGARVREMTEDEKVELKSKINFRERVPMLMERVEVDPEEDEVTVSEEQYQAELDFSAAMSEPVEELSAEADSTEEPEADKVSPIEDIPFVEKPDESVSEQDRMPAEEIIENKEEPVEVMPEEPVTEQDRMPAEGIIENKEEPDEAMPEEPVTVDVPKENGEIIDIDVGPVEDIVIIHVMAPRGEELSGSSVLDLLVTAGLRYGPMDIFHYRNPKGITEFSLVNCVHPGTFDPDAMNQINTPGVTLFMQLPTAADAMEAFDHMYEMGVFLAKHLNAQILDEDHSTVTPQRIEYYREKLRTFTRARLLSSH